MAVTVRRGELHLAAVSLDRRTSLAWSFGRMEIANNFSFQHPTGKGN